MHAYPLALFDQRLGGVGDQVQDHLAELRRFGFDGGKLGVEIEMQGRLAGDRRGDQLAHVVDELRYVESLYLNRLLPRVGEHLGGECGGAWPR